MSAHGRRPDELPTAEVTALVDAYLASLRAALPAEAAEECEEAVEDMRAYVLEQLEGGAGTPAEAARVLAELGPPTALATRFVEVAIGETRKEKRSILRGRVLGMPYDLRPPTAARVASRWWDPLDPHVFTPRLFGIGWTINFAAVAVRLGLVRPDDEEVPFGLVPPRSLRLALALPLAMAVGMAVLVVFCQPALPAAVPVHFALDDSPDRFASKGMALVLPSCMTLLGTVLVVWTWARRRTPVLRVAAGSLAMALAAVSIAAYGQQVTAAHGGNGLVILIVGLAAALVLPFALLVTLSRVGRAAEQRRDFESNGKKGGT